MSVVVVDFASVRNARCIKTRQAKENMDLVG
jgi:hypothetical protein